MTVSPANKVRWHIMLLAITGSMGFGIYLLVVFLIALQNEHRLQDIVQIKQPVIEHLRSSEEALEGFRSSLTNAISLEDPYLVEDAQAHARAIETHLQALTALDPNSREEADQLLTVFQEHREHAVRISSQLVEDPGKAYDFQSDVETITTRQNDIALRMSAFMDKNLKEYAVDLNEAGTAMQETRMWGVILGLLTIALLMTLAMTISVTARNAITRSDRLKDEFLSTISHELRTPMNGIMGAISLLRSTDMSASQTQLLDAASTSSSDMLLAVTDILEFSDFLNGNVAIKHKEFTLSALLRDIVTKARNECQTRGILFEADYEEKQWVYDGDVDHISHVLRHLLGNAVKFTQTGTVSLRVTMTNQSVGEAQLTFSVRDSGPGVPDHLIEDIFKPFQQLDGSFKRKFGGLGIGLSICKHITRALKGEIAFANHPQGGAVVTFSVPIIYRESLAATQVSEPALASAPAPAPSVPYVATGVGKLPLTVLVVEDNKVNQMVINGYLKKMGCTVVTANNGQEGVEKASSQYFDVILMDCQMPVMDGFEATQAIRNLQQSRAAHLPIIAVTANAMEGDRERCVASGMTDYLSKPVDIGTLRAAIERNITLTSTSERNTKVTLAAG